MMNYPTKTYDGKPGRYLCECYKCQQKFWGDKRDIICAKCESENPSIRTPDLKPKK